MGRSASAYLFFGVIIDESREEYSLFEEGTLFDLASELDPDPKPDKVIILNLGYEGGDYGITVASTVEWADDCGHTRLQLPLITPGHAELDLLLRQHNLPDKPQWHLAAEYV